ncbi:MAG: hypothetical protein ACOYKZ_06870, partial [Chlamydiia bacterium]
AERRAGERWRGGALLRTSLEDCILQTTEVQEITHRLVPRRNIHGSEEDSTPRLLPERAFDATDQAGHRIGDDQWDTDSELHPVEPLFLGRLVDRMQSDKSALFAFLGAACKQFVASV